MIWTNDFKNFAAKWESKEEAEKVAEKCRESIGDTEYIGTLKDVVVTGHSTKPASDPDYFVHGVRGTFETQSGGEIELWLEA